MAKQEVELYRVSEVERPHSSECAAHIAHIAKKNSYCDHLFHTYAHAVCYIKHMSCVPMCIYTVWIKSL